MHRNPRVRGWTAAAVASTGALVAAAVGTVGCPAAAAPQEPPVAAVTRISYELGPGPVVPPTTTTTTITTASLVVRRVPAAAVVGVSRQGAGQRCWSGRAHLESASLAGTTVYSWWQTLRWCSRDARRISAWRLLDRGGETSTPGWSYAGPGRRGQVVAAGTLRSYTQERFTFSVLWTSYTSTPCAQIRATATGRATISTACGL